MAKRDLLLHPGEQLPVSLWALLSDHFSPLEIEKLRKFGGRIQISLTAPYNDRVAQNQEFSVDEAFVKSLLDRPRESKSLLATLTRDQLATLANALRFPFGSKVTISELRKSIFDFLNSQEKWNEISVKQ
jgi:hypothetical protein